MATIVAKPAVHTPVRALVAAAVLAGIVAGVVIGYLAAPARTAPATEATAAQAQVAADNAFVDRWYAAFANGDRAAVEAMLRPSFKFESVGKWATNAAGMWGFALGARSEGLVHSRTTDVTRVGDVLFWAGRWVTTGVADSSNEYTYTVLLDPEGRMARMVETPY